jgi:PIN domain nuclease of toxin-antitoxin system
MNIDVSYDALLHALVEAVRDERDHGTAMMTLVSRLVDEACQQDWFEAHWRTDARLKLAQMACGQMPMGWRSAVPVLEVIAEAARWALKADEIDGDARASLLAITRLADVERSGRTAAQSERRRPRPAGTQGGAACHARGLAAANGGR